jgi:hypothetical protein
MRRDLEFFDHAQYHDRGGIDCNRHRFGVGAAIAYVDCLSSWLIRVYIGPLKLWWRIHCG